MILIFSGQKTLYQNILSDIAFFFTLFKGYRCNKLSVITPRTICMGNSMIWSDVWHKYHVWYFEIVIGNFKFVTILKYHEWYLCQISRTNHTIICLYYYQQKFVILTCRYFRLSWNTTALSQSNCRNFSSSGITNGRPRK